MGIGGGLGDSGKKGKMGKWDCLDGRRWVGAVEKCRRWCVGGLGTDDRWWNGVWRWLEVRETKMRGRKTVRRGEKWGKGGEKVT
jgi:hypothetical protein